MIFYYNMNILIDDFFFIFQDWLKISIIIFYYLLWINNHAFKISRGFITFTGMKTFQIITDTALHINFLIFFYIRVGRIYIQ